jgi:DNA helicase-2/ATP-dependent DNA helicase PcrA
MHKHTPLSFTSPRLRGEVGAFAPGEAESPHIDSPPHPNPLPASGEREQT